ncbi:MAG: PDZ domain-containing protein [Planctomycetes bacterium]|jgi:hypothetical protein|nr:PDZ domain-containing protein [Planctomycetota bacterium]MBT4028029.1 PDZ domain-containing protein [Planctomycetota bacterium]MBT4561081.1 PDZ domain-containing protein [Planctomycetota bacterium]MBT5100500.1 PDZ domain-containing protein [Planctomycetota bacterium]MBT7012953.1 PDZ domain-containing protein [Planctomycetota bacterium]
MRLFSLTPFLITAVISAAPVLAQQAQLGVQVAPSDAGPRVETVLPRSAASILGLVAGDVLLAVDDVRLTSPASLVAAIRAHRAGDIVNLTIQREGATFEMLGVLARAQHDVLPDSRSSLGQSMRGHLQDMGEGVHHRLQEIDLDSLPAEIRERFQQGMQRMPDMQGLGHDFAQGFSDFERHFDDFGQQFTFDFDFFGEGDTEMLTETWLTYPESTPQDKREVLIADAVKTYGADVHVVFEGNVTMMRSTSRSVQRQPELGTDAAPEASEEGPSRLELIRAAAEEQVENLKNQILELEKWLESSD